MSAGRPVAGVQRIVHESGRVLADEVETANALAARARGLMFRRSIPEGYALVFPFDGAGRRRLHMVCVPFPIDACWLRDGVVERTATLRPWIGTGAARADTVIEFPAGALDGVAPSDAIEVRDAG
jgi:uncharacterized membrane protein (UPF0127 family)